MERIKLFQSIPGFVVRVDGKNHTIIFRTETLNAVGSGGEKVESVSKFRLVAKPECSDETIVISQETWESEEAARKALQNGFNVNDPADRTKSPGRAIIGAMLDQGVACFV